jgi:hypothetical protein
MQLIVALSETRRIQEKIDKLIRSVLTSLPVGVP